MHHYRAFTLVDITQTNSRFPKDKLLFNQQQNLNTLIQSIGLRSQPLETQCYCLMTQDIVEYGFGKRYKGLHTVWILDFSIEHSNVFANNTNELGHLLNDCNGVPIYVGLEETADSPTKTFETINEDLINLYFMRNRDI